MLTVIVMICVGVTCLAALFALAAYDCEPDPEEDYHG